MHSEFKCCSHLSKVKTGTSWTERQFIIKASLWLLLSPSYWRRHMCQVLRAPSHLILIRDLYIGRPPVVSSSSRPPTCRSLLFHGCALFSLPSKVSATKEHVIKALPSTGKAPMGNINLRPLQRHHSASLFSFFSFPRRKLTRHIIEFSCWRESIVIIYCIKRHHGGHLIFFLLLPPY